MYISHLDATLQSMLSTSVLTVMVQQNYNVSLQKNNQQGYLSGR
jgi:hypothetical protein